MRKSIIKILLVIACFISHDLIFAQGVKWEKLTLNEAIRKARNNIDGKNTIFVDCYKEWSQPNKHMIDEVLSKSDAGSYFNRNFINIRIDMEKGDGPNLEKKYSIRVYPTYLILDSYGNELGRVIGGGKIQSFINKVEKAKSPFKTEKKDLLSLYMKNQDINTGLEYLESLELNNQKSKMTEFFNQYYDYLSWEDRYNKKTWDYIKKSITIRDITLLDKVLEDKDRYDTFFGSNVVNNDLSNALLSELVDYLNGTNNYIDPKYVKKMYNISKRLNGNNENFFTLINNVVTKQLEGDINGIFRILDVNQLKTSLNMVEMSFILDIVVNMKSAPDSKKAAFISEYRNILNKALNETTYSWNKYKRAFRD